MKRAIEVEYWVVDREGELSAPGSLTRVSKYVEEEFVDPLVELKTPPCETHAELRSTYLDLLERVLERADEQGKLLVPLGTPIDGAAIDRLPSERSRIQRRVLGTDFDYASYCAGTHLHFEQQNVTDQLNVLIALDPALALLNSSPYFQGEPIANGARAFLYRRKCYEQFPKHGQLWEYVESVGEWERRLDHRFEEFKTAAVEAGVEAAAVDEHFSPDTVVWTPVRLRDSMPTVEWRSPDAALPSQVLRLARDAETVMQQIPVTVVSIGGESGAVTADGITIPEFDVVCDYADAAIEDGIESPMLATYLDAMGFDVDGYHPLSQELGAHGAVSASDACDLRVEYGKRLRQDVTAMLGEPLGA